MALTQVSSAGIKNAEVKTEDILDANVTTAKIADDAITNAKIGANAVASNELNDACVGTAKIVDDAVTADKLANSINTDIAAKAVLTGSTNNTITTVTGANAIQGEANLTYDGSHLSIATDASAEGLKITSTGNTYNEISFDADRTSANNHLGRIVANWDGTTVSYISLDAGDDTTNKDDGIIRFHTSASGGNNLERLRIDSSGRLLAGTTTPGDSGADDLTIATSGGTGITIRSGDTSNGSIYFSDGTSGAPQYAGFIQYNHGSDNKMYFGAGSSTRFQVESNGNVKVNDGDLVIGTSGHGIDFSATSDGSGTDSSELFQDYEEGTWVPYFNNVTAGTYGHQSGRYTKVGRFVYCTGQITIDSGLDNSDGSAINIGGLPYAGNHAHDSCILQIGRFCGLLTSTTLSNFKNVRFNSTSVMFYGGNDSQLAYNGCNTSGVLQFSFSYQM